MEGGNEQNIRVFSFLKMGDALEMESPASLFCFVAFF